ncbi:MAG: cytochrome c [Deltaproteobacteria bacterium]|nr:cytochrome c [Deltaproteobacteria bacterium]
MRKTHLNQASVAVWVTLVCVAVLFALVRSFAMHPDDPAAKQGSQLFASEGCAHCHVTDSEEAKIGPGLKGLFKRDTLPASGREATEENVTKQLKTPYKNMPSYADRLNDEERDQLIAYLGTL